MFKALAKWASRAEIDPAVKSRLHGADIKITHFLKKARKPVALVFIPMLITQLYLPYIAKQLSSSSAAGDVITLQDSISDSNIKIKHIAISDYPSYGLNSRGEIAIPDNSSVYNNGDERDGNDMFDETADGDTGDWIKPGDFGNWTSQSSNPNGFTTSKASDDSDLVNGIWGTSIDGDGSPSDHRAFRDSTSIDGQPIKAGGEDTILVRHEFNLTADQASRISSANFSAKADDWLRVFVNGNLVGADSSHGSKSPSELDKTVAKGNFVEGKNILAIQVTNKGHWKHADYFDGVCSGSNKEYTSIVENCDKESDNGAGLDYSLALNLSAALTTLSINKEVGLLGGTWQKSVNADPGDKIKFNITVKNTGSSSASNVFVRDILPQNVTYTDNSATLFSALYPSGTKLNPDENLFTQNGYNFGTLQSTASLAVQLEVTVGSNFAVGQNTLVNTAFTRADGISEVSSNAQIVVTIQGQEQFGNLQIIKYIDADGDAIRDEGEAPMSGVTFTVNGGQAGTTDSNGNLFFNNLPEGEYTVVESVPAGFVSTTGDSKVVTVSDNNTTQVVFGNQQVNEKIPPMVGGVSTLPRVGAAANAAVGTFLLLSTLYLYFRERIRFEMAFYHV